MFTQQEIRGAILDTALLFERSPALFDFWKTHVPCCETPGCAIGHIARALGIKDSVNAGAFTATANALGYSSPYWFYLAMNECGGETWSDGAPLAAAALRKFVEHKFPAPAFPESHQLVSWSSIRAVCQWQPGEIA